MTVSRTFYNFYPVLTPVRLASTTNISGSYSNGPLNKGVNATLTINGGLSTLDGVSLLLNDYVLLRSQTNTNENGIYQVTFLGTPTVLTRRSDFQSIEQIQTGQIVTVGAGNTLAGSAWVVSEPLPAAFGIDGLIFNPVASLSGSGFLLASNNLSDVPNKSTAINNLGAQFAADIKAGVTGNIGGSGAGPITVLLTGITSTSIICATVKSSSNPVSVLSCTANLGDFVVTLSGDPGANCTLNFIALVNPQ